MTETEQPFNGQTYRIGAVARLTGISPDTLRVWERRYAVVEPLRSEAGTRLYSAEDVGRLTLIKRLVDNGDAISHVAALTLVQLQERSRGLDLMPIADAERPPCRVVVLGPTLPTLLTQDGAPMAMLGEGVELVGAFEDEHRFHAAMADLKADLLVINPAIPKTVPVIQAALDAGVPWTTEINLFLQTCRARIAAVTGSVGKTTVKDLTVAAVGAGRAAHASRGSFNNELGVPLTALGLERDTEVLIAEIGARHRGDIADLAPIVAPDVAVVTSVAAVHLGIFGSIDDIAVAKAELVTSLGPEGLAVLHLADPRVAAMARLAPRSLTVAIDRPDADVHA
ncbi:MAG: Mur ligase family protein, partial [Halochromatium sp.]